MHFISSFYSVLYKHKYKKKNYTLLAIIIIIAELLSLHIFVFLFSHFILHKIILIDAVKRMSVRVPAGRSKPYSIEFSKLYLIRWNVVCINRWLYFLIFFFFWFLFQACVCHQNESHELCLFDQKNIYKMHLFRSLMHTNTTWTSVL